MELEQWLREHPPEARGLKAHAAALHQLRSLGYTQEQMRAWLNTQGMSVSRQAISKFFCTAAQPTATHGNSPQPEATARQPSCNPLTNPNAAPPPAPAEPLTLKARAQAVGDRYLQQTLSPTASQLLQNAPPRKP